MKISVKKRDKVSQESCKIVDSFLYIYIFIYIHIYFSLLKLFQAIHFLDPHADGF